MIKYQGEMMKKALVLVDFQNDFIDGSLGTKEAQAIIPNVIEKLSQYSKENRLATQDTHFEDYLTTQEGKNLPVIHCQNGTFGWEIRKEAQVGFAKIFEKKQLLVPEHWQNLFEMKIMMKLNLSEFVRIFVLFPMPC